VRYVRLPCGQNHKLPTSPWDVKVLSWHPEAVYSLADAAAIFGVDVDALVVQAAAPAGTLAPAGGDQGDKMQAATAAILRGAELHDSINIVAASMIASGAHGGAVVHMLRALMDASAAPRDDRWQCRYDDIPRAVSSAEAKFSDHSGIADALLSADGTEVSAIEATEALNAGAAVIAAQQVTDDTMPPELLSVPGVMSDCIAWMLRTAHRTQPTLMLGAAISLFATALAGKVRSETGLRTNLYIVASGGTSSGKEHGRTVISEAMAAAGLSDILGGDTIASGQGLLARATAHPRTVFLLDEFGLALSAMRSRNAGSHLAGIVINLMTLYGSTGKVMRGTEYADQGVRPRVDIPYPCVNLFATTTPAQLFPHCLAQT